MLSKEFCKEFNGKEITWSFLWALDHKFNAVVLASPKKGVSVKPYWESDEEKEKFIKLQLSNNNHYDEEKQILIEVMEDPTFCFLHMKNTVSEDELRQILTDGNLTSDKNYIDGTILPICPFA